MPRPKLAITRSRAKKLRDIAGLKSDKELGDLVKRIGITKNQWYETQNPIYLQLKKGKLVNKRNGELLIQNIPTEEAPILRPDITEVQKKSFRNVSNEFHFNNHVIGSQSLNIIGSSANKIIEGLKIHKNVKFFISVYVNFYHLKDPEMKLTALPRTFSSRIINHISELKGAIDDIKTELRNWIESVEAKESDLIFDSIKSMMVAVNKHKPLRGGSYVELDDYLTNKKCCINIKNKDNLCFKYCILYHFHKDEIKKDPQRVSKYKPFDNDFDWSKFKFPMPLNQIEKVENMIEYGVNIYGYDDKVVFPLRITKINTDKIISLLLINDHYVYIKDINILVSPNKYDEEGKHITHTSFACQNCLHCFSAKGLLEKHRNNGCDLFEPTKSELPKMIKNEDGTFSKPTIEFNQHVRKFKAPVVIYGDFETLIKKHDTAEKNPIKSSTQQLAELPPCSYAFNVVSDYPELNMGFQMFRGKEGDNVVLHFLQNLVKIGDKIRRVLDTEKEMIITAKQEKAFQCCTECHICNKPIEDEPKVRDHDHITGLYRGCAHQSCNVNYNFKNYKIPVYFHNLKGFDGHLIIQGLRDMNFSNIKLIAQNFEKYMSIAFGEFRFLDSFAFMSSSLDTLATNLLKDGADNFKHTLTGNLTDEQKSLIVKKGVYPYEYINSYERFNETELPAIDEFYSTLNEEGIEDKEYEHAIKVWKTFNINNIGEYHDLYLKTDVLLLSDIFEAFRETAMTNYDLDPSNGYFTLPNFAWMAMLKKTGVVLELLTDIDMYQFCEQGIRGGTSLISHRYAKANNKYMKDYNENDISSHIMYLDANNLYGEAMIQNLPTGGFKWAYYIDEEFIRNYDDNDIGYFVKCDLEYPNELHDLHNNYPLAVESRAIDFSELSPYQLNQIESHNEKHNDKIKKLVPNLYNKVNYVCHIRNLKYYLEKGLKLSKIHQVLQFNQSKWLKPYIDFNTQKRTVSKNEFEKDLYKLMNNAVFGKTMENMRARVDIQLCTDADKLVRIMAKPQYMESRIYKDDALVAVKQVPKKVELNKPIYVGLSVLDLSKLHMYQFHYDYIKPKYGNDATLLFTDTDSLCYHIKTDDIYKDMKEDAHLFDMSAYSMDGYRSKDDTNKKVIGKFKDETDGVPIVEFCGLRSKMYSIKLDDDKEKKTGKGIKKSALKKYVRHEDYKRCLLGGFDDERQLISFNNLRSKDHNIGMYRFTKVGLSCSNDKQYLLGDGIASLSYGHYKI